MKNSTSSRQTTQKHTQKAKKQNDSNDQRYKPYLIKLMSFMDGVNYASDRKFTSEDLAQITP